MSKITQFILEEKREMQEKGKRLDRGQGRGICLVAGRCECAFFYAPTNFDQIPINIVSLHLVQIFYNSLYM